MFSNWPCSVEREGRREERLEREREDRHKREEEKRRNDWTFVCSAACLFGQAVVYSCFDR